VSFILASLNSRFESNEEEEEMRRTSAPERGPETSFHKQTSAKLDNVDEFSKPRTTAPHATRKLDLVQVAFR